METMSYCVVYTAKEGQRDAFVKDVFSSGLLETIRSAEGCQTYDYYISEESDERLMLMETWESDAHREKHLHQPAMEQLNQLIADYIVDIEIIS